MMHREGTTDGGDMKLGTYLHDISGYIFQVLFDPPLAWMAQGRALFGGKGEEEEDILTETSPEKLSSSSLL